MKHRKNRKGQSFLIDFYIWFLWLGVFLIFFMLFFLTGKSKQNMIEQKFNNHVPHLLVEGFINQPFMHKGEQLTLVEVISKAELHPEYGQIFSEKFNTQFFPTYFPGSRKYYWASLFTTKELEKQSPHWKTGSTIPWFAGAIQSLCDRNNLETSTVIIQPIPLYLSGDVVNLVVCIEKVEENAPFQKKK